jgi:hypothetical protein
MQIRTKNDIGREPIVEVVMVEFQLCITMTNIIIGSYSTRAPC